MDASRRLRPICGSIKNIWLSWWNQLLPMFLVNASCFSFRSCWFFNPFFEQVLGSRVFKYLPFMYEVDSFKSHSQDEGYIRTFRFYFAPDVCDEKPEHCRNHVFLPRDPHWIPPDMTPKRMWGIQMSRVYRYFRYLGGSCNLSPVPLELGSWGLNRNWEPLGFSDLWHGAIWSHQTGCSWWRKNHLDIPILLFVDSLFSCAISWSKKAARKTKSIFQKAGGKIKQPVLFIAGDMAVNYCHS